MQYLTSIVTGIVSEVKNIGKLTIVVLEQGQYKAEVKLGDKLTAPKLKSEVKYKGTAKAKSYKDKPMIEFWANEVVA